MPAVAVVFALGCADTSLGNVADSGTPQVDEMDASRRVKPRTVSIELFEVVHRELIEGDNGELVYGSITPIEDADACVKARRDAFASFTPFTPLEDPICVKIRSGEPVLFESVPANSDLLITIEKDGYLPASLTFRTDDRSSPRPQNWIGIVTPVFRPGEWQPWLEPDAATGRRDGQVWIYALMEAAFPSGQAVPPGAELPIGKTVVPGLTLAEGGAVEVQPQPRGEPFSISLLDRPRFLSLPEGSYRLVIDQPDVPPCPAVGVANQYLPLGLPTDVPEAMELTILAGHTTVAIPWCVCDWAPSERVVDLATCKVESSDPDSP